MLKLADNSFMVERVNELPLFIGVKELFLDVETDGLDPYMGDRICGIAVTAEDHPEGYYVPIRHRREGKRYNLPLENVQRWLGDVTLSAENWINHNVKFDLHFCSQEFPERLGDYPFKRLVDTLTLSKLHNSDLFKYGLKKLCRDWGIREMPEELQIKSYLEGIKTREFKPCYADIPPDMLGAYAVGDVHGNRLLWKYIKKHCPESVDKVWETEILLTAVLYDMEREGLQIDPQEVKIEQYKTLTTMLKLGDELNELVGKEINAKSHVDVYDLLINQYGLPVMAIKPKDKNDPDAGSSPTFDKHALKLYMTHPTVLADANMRRSIELIHAYRGEAQYNSLFLETFSTKHVGGVLHPDFNQCVRTGRMSCSRPNAQQQNKRSKKLIHPKSGKALLSCDYSQIEFRIIVHYINDLTAIQAYHQNPNQDFHAWVADQVGIKRKPAKNLNFAMGFGAGKNRILTMLKSDPDIMAHVGEEINRDIAAGVIREANRAKEYMVRVELHANKIYGIYHDTLPGLKEKSRQAYDTAKWRGYVFNQAGRRRHLDVAFAHKAFNSVIQSFAADIMKERTVALSPRYNQFLRERDIKIILLVHDETTFTGDIEVMRDKTTQRYIKYTMENPAFKIRVPIVTGMGYSKNNWAEAGGEDRIVDAQGNYVGGPVELKPLTEISSTLGANRVLSV